MTLGAGFKYAELVKSATYLQSSDDLFQEAFDRGDIVLAGVRDDGVALFDRVVDNDSTRGLVEKRAGSIRRVRTPGGAKKYGLPIGAPITADAIRRALPHVAHKHAEKIGKAKTQDDIAKIQDAVDADKGLTDTQKNMLHELAGQRLDALGLSRLDDQHGTLEGPQTAAGGGATAPKQAAPAAPKGKPNAQQVAEARKAYTEHKAAIEGAKDQKEFDAAYKAMEDDPRLPEAWKNDLAGFANQVQDAGFAKPPAKPPAKAASASGVDPNAIMARIADAKDQADIDALKKEIGAAWKGGKIKAGVNQGLVRRLMEKQKELKAAPAKKAPAKRDLNAERNAAANGFEGPARPRKAPPKKAAARKAPAQSGNATRRRRIQAEIDAKKAGQKSSVKDKIKNLLQNGLPSKKVEPKKVAQAMGRDQVQTPASAPKKATPKAATPKPPPPAPVAPNAPGTAASLPKPYTNSLPAKGEGKAFIVADVADDFTDADAMRAFLDMNDADGKPLFGGKHGALVMVENNKGGLLFKQIVDEHNAKHPSKKIDVRVSDMKGDGRGTAQRRRGERLQAMDKAIEENNGRGYVVGFRNPGGTVGTEADIVNLHLARGKDSRGNEAEALVIQPGYRGQKNRRGEDVDPNAFGLNQEDVQNAPIKDPAADKVIFSPDQMAPKKGGLDVKGFVQKQPLPGADENGPYNDADTPAGRHFVAGGDVWDAPAEGLAQFIMNNRQRFRQEALKGGGISESFGVIDMKTGKRYFVKQAEEGGLGKMVGDAANEVFVANLGLELAPDLYLRTRYADDPNLKKTFIIAEHAQDKHMGNGKVEAAGRGGGQKFENPQEWLQFHLFDYLLNQSDRHPGNWMEVRMPNGNVRPVPIDNGAAVNAHYGVGGRDRYEDWLGIGHLQAPQNYWLPMLGSNYRGKEARLKKDLDDIIKKFEAMDPQSTAERLIREYGLKDREAAYHRAAAALYSKRLKQLKKERAAIIKRVMKGR